MLDQVLRSIWHCIEWLYNNHEWYMGLATTYWHFQDLINLNVIWNPWENYQFHHHDLESWWNPGLIPRFLKWFHITWYVANIQRNMLKFTKIKMKILILDASQCSFQQWFYWFLELINMIQHYVWPLCPYNTYIIVLIISSYAQHVMMYI